MNWKCKIGWHDWRMTDRGLADFSEAMGRGAILMELEHKCIRCGKRMVR